MLLKFISFFLIILVIAISDVSSKENYEPIIGMLSQRLSSTMKPRFPDSDSYIAASYIKWAESGGARAVPIWIDKSTEYYHDIMGKING
jgi:gamma-glutamyl hydrolase